MEARMKSRANPGVMTAIQHLNEAIQAGGVDPLLLELVHLRASQINDCSPCVFAGVASAKKRGETEERLHNVVTWRETPFFTEEERAEPDPHAVLRAVVGGAARERGNRKRRGARCRHPGENTNLDHGTPEACSKRVTYTYIGT